MPDLFAVLAHPARRTIVEHLHDGPEESGELADLLFLRHRLTWPSTSKHLRVLREAGVVTSTAWETYRVYELRENALASHTRWVERYGGPAAPTRPGAWFCGR